MSEVPLKVDCTRGKLLTQTGALKPSGRPNGSNASRTNGSNVSRARLGGLDRCGGVVALRDAGEI